MTAALLMRSALPVTEHRRHMTGLVFARGKFGGGGES